MVHGLSVLCRIVILVKEHKPSAMAVAVRNPEMAARGWQCHPRCFHQQPLWPVSRQNIAFNKPEPDAPRTNPRFQASKLTNSWVYGVDRQSSAKGENIEELPWFTSMSQTNDGTSAVGRGSLRWQTLLLDGQPPMLPARTVVRVVRRDCTIRSLWVSFSTGQDRRHMLKDKVCGASRHREPQPKEKGDTVSRAGERASARATILSPLECERRSMPENEGQGARMLPGRAFSRSGRHNLHAFNLSAESVTVMEASGTAK